MTSVVAMDENGRVIVETRTWSAVWRAGDPQIPAPALCEGFCLAQADMGAPVTWGLTIQSSDPLSVLDASVEVMGVGGTVRSFQGQYPLPFIGGPPIAGMGIRVVLRKGAVFLPGEQVLVSLAPLVWPEWARPRVAFRRAGFTL